MRFGGRLSAMRRAVLVLMLALVAFAGLAPVIEAGCVEACADDAPDACCTCCVHLKADTARAAASPEAPGRGHAAGAPRVASPDSSDPRDILHVPKPFFS